MDDIDILWLPATGWNKFRFGNTWHAHPGDVEFVVHKPICKQDMGGKSLGKVWNKPWSEEITWVCEKCQRQMTMWEMAE
jgi:hypothetical protein